MDVFLSHRLLLVHDSNNGEEETLMSHAAELRLTLSWY